MSDVNWGGWAWENRDKFTVGVSAVCRWLWEKFKSKGQGSSNEELPDERPGVLVLGAGGVGKSTFGRVLSGNVNPFFNLPGTYEESFKCEKFEPKGVPGVEVLIPPGQEIRREALWNEPLAGLSTGKFNGMILVQAYGFHNHQLGFGASYKDHPLYDGDINRFRQAFLNDRREEELKVVRDIIPRVTPPPGGKFWVLSLVTKQDLWWDDRAQAREFYTAGEYRAEIAKVEALHGASLFRHEVAFVSLEISNFKTGKGEQLWTNTAGYDHEQHANSLKDLFAKFEALHSWEVGK